MSDQIITERFRRLGIEPRSADVQAVQLLGDDAEGEIQAEYIWDHLLGEPERPTLDEVLAALQVTS